MSYFKAKKIDKRGIRGIFYGHVFRKFDLISIFCFRKEFELLSLCLNIFLFEICLDYTFNALLFSDDVMSQKYNNGGDLNFFTTIILSCFNTGGLYLRKYN